MAANVTVTYHNTGQGITNNHLPGSYVWGKHGFNPTSDTTDGYQSWDIWANPSPAGTVYGDIVAYNQSTSFSLTGYQFGNEVVMMVFSFINLSGSQQTVSTTLTFKDPDGNAVLTYSWNNVAVPNNSWFYYWIGMGMGADGYEIWKNGTYTAEYSVTDAGGTSTGSINVTITNYSEPVGYTANQGYLWVEGDYLAFVCQQGYKILCQHDGTVYSSGNTAGYIWLEADGYISYIDADGDERRTKKGDRYGYGGWSSEIPASPGASYAGNIWVCNDNNDTYLVAISNNGVKYRIGAGFVDSGDYQ